MIAILVIKNRKIRFIRNDSFSELTQRYQEITMFAEHVFVDVLTGNYLGCQIYFSQHYPEIDY
jgi:hypothetical protein